MRTLGYGTRGVDEIVPLNALPLLQNLPPPAIRQLPLLPLATRTKKKAMGVLPMCSTSSCQKPNEWRVSQQPKSFAVSTGGLGAV